MRLLCPFCQKSITVPDSEAGKEVNCPECHERFAAPQLYTPVPPSPPAPPTPAEPPPAPPGQPAAPDEPAPVPETYLTDRPADTPAPHLPDLPPLERELSGYRHMSSLPLEPRVVRWVPVATLLLAFVLTFFPWDGLYPAGYAAYTQNAWDGLFGWVGRDDVAESEFKYGDDLENRTHMSGWLLPYLLLLLPAVAVAAAGPLVDQFGLKLPPAVERVWPYRAAILGALSVLLLLFLLAQWAGGFGLQRAVTEKVAAESEARKMPTETQEQRKRAEMRLAEDKGRFHIRTTFWLRLTVLCHLLAVPAVAAEAALALRGTRPPPRAAVMW